jgi:hypothetical protein
MRFRALTLMLATVSLSACDNASQVIARQIRQLPDPSVTRTAVAR